jgi:ABC-2 type transport system ATP-binding protein
MRVREYLDFFGAAFDIPPGQRTKRVDHVMELTGTAYMKDRFVESLSHGMQQRVGLARTLVHDPKVLILDEPVNGLDPQARIEMRDLLIELARQGKTLLVTSHILPELARICHQVAIITNGQLRARGTVDEIGRQVSQRRTVEAQLASADQVPAAAQIIRQCVETGAEVVEAQAEATVRFGTALPESDLGDVLAQLVQAGIRVTQFREVQTDLEEAFMSFARPQKAAAGKPLAVAGASSHA